MIIDYTKNDYTLYEKDGKLYRENCNLFVPNGLSIKVIGMTGKKLFYLDAEPIDKMDKRLSYWHDKYPEYFV